MHGIDPKANRDSQLVFEDDNAPFLGYGATGINQSEWVVVSRPRLGQLDLLKY